MNRKVLRIHLLLIFVLLFSNSARLDVQAQRKVDFTTLERTISEELRDSQTPGAAVAVILDDRVIFAKVFGEADVETKAPVTSKTLFRLASTTKMLTAAALIRLVAEGKIGLDEPVGKYVKGLSPKLSQLTLHQLLSHTSGIQDGASDFGLHDDAALGDFIRTWKDDYLFTDSGRVFSYSNLGYDLAGFVLENVTGKPYPDAMEELLFKPLGMKSSAVRPTMAMTRPISQGHQTAPDGKTVVVRPFADEAREWPSGGVFTTVEDFSRFLVAFLNNGRLEGKQVLPTTVVAKLSTPYAVNPSGNVQKHSQYSYGLNVLEEDGTRVFQHGGSMAGFGSLVRIVPDRRFAIVILTNKTGSLLIKSMDKATELVTALNLQAPSESLYSLPMTEAEMKAYEGSYVNNPTYLSVEVLRQDGKLFLRQRGSEQKSQIIKIADKRFSVDGQEFVFLFGKDGKVEYLHIEAHAFKKSRTEE